MTRTLISTQNTMSCTDDAASIGSGGLLRPSLKDTMVTLYIACAAGRRSNGVVLAHQVVARKLSRSEKTSLLMFLNDKARTAGLEPLVTLPPWVRTTVPSHSWYTPGHSWPSGVDGSSGQDPTDPQTQAMRPLSRGSVNVFCPDVPTWAILHVENPAGPASEQRFALYMENAGRPSGSQGQWSVASKPLTVGGLYHCLTLTIKAGQRSALRVRAVITNVNLIRTTV